MKKWFLCIVCIFMLSSCSAADTPPAALKKQDPWSCVALDTPSSQSNSLEWGFFKTVKVQMMPQAKASEMQGDKPLRVQFSIQESTTDLTINSATDVTRRRVVLTLQYHIMDPLHKEMLKETSSITRGQSMNVSNIGYFDLLTKQNLEQQLIQDLAFSFTSKLSFLLESTPHLCSS